MGSIDPSELSASLDGELPAEACDRVRAALAADDSLRKQYEQLMALDAKWRSAASGAQFRPNVQLENPKSRIVPIAVLGCALLVVRLAIKAPPPAIGAAIDCVLLTLMVSWGFGRILRFAESDREQVRFSPQTGSVV